jgi:hypothetical protein
MTMENVRACSLNGHCSRRPKLSHRYINKVCNAVWATVKRIAISLEE